MTPERIQQINDLINGNPGWHRTKLSQELCRIWGWVGENGQIKDVSCRDALRALDASGKIKLPERLKNGHPKGCADNVVLMAHDMAPVEGPLSALAPLAVRVVTGKDELMEFKSYIEQYHYLGYDRNIGENIKYFIHDQHGRCLACLMFGSAAWSCGPRDAYIGLGKERRQAALKYMTNNSRFLVFPWVKASCLASHVLSLVCRRVSSDWVAKYGHPVYLLETFVECDRFAGTCYKAANWTYVGKTTGRGRNSETAIGTLPVKDIYVYPLHKRFREALGIQEGKGTGDGHR
ncbi:MAG: DUF4338 domain-containing protein [Clostridiales bacterium]|nr:DUF4338 domain-containing protein [Clostridiales bacterium]